MDTDKIIQDQTNIFFHHFAWPVAFTKSSQKNSTHLLLLQRSFCLSS